MKLGSLFDGSGGFPLSGFLCGIEPIWASEVEPYPIAVTKSRFPHMKHLGDINKINGTEIEPVDIITFGSPCQDLSVAGKRAGLKHENNGDDETTRSGLFMEAVRIIKEMREKTNGKYPRWICWENVPGAFSSNKGEDFKIVLEEIIKIASPSAVMPEVPKFGWPYADSYCGDGWSLAYRVLDAQYWGVPQRRRRIYLVADFGGQCAREILFEREGLRGYFTEGRTPWEAAPADAERGVGADDCERAIPYTLKIRSGCEGGGKGALIQKNQSATLACNNDQYLFQPVAYSFDAISSNSMKSSNPHSGCREVNVARTIDTSNPDPSKNQGGIAIVEPIAVATQQGGAEITENGICPTITAAAGLSGNNQPWICQNAEGFDAYNQALTGDKSMTVTCASTDAHHVPCVVLDDQGGSQISVRNDGKAPTLRAEMHGNIPCVVEPTITLEPGIAAREGGHIYEGVSGTLRANAGDNQMAVAYGVTTKGNGDAFISKERHTSLCSGGGQAGQGYPCVTYCVENHPADSRVSLDESGKVQTLTSRMGTGGGNVPMVMEPVPFCKSKRAQSADDVTTWKDGKVANTLNTFDQGEARANEIIVETIALEGNGQRPSHRGDGYLVTDKSYTLNATEQHGVVYAVDQGGGKSSVVVRDNQAPTLTCTHDGSPAVAYSFDPGASRDVGVLFIEECAKTLTNGTCPGHHDGVVISNEPIAIDRAAFNQGENALYDPQINEDGTTSTLVAKGPSAVCYQIPPKPVYIVRRLTPTECARLQGFADRWGDIDAKKKFTDEEYHFWLEVRNTHAAINGKKIKEYTKAQMLTWYNKLNTDGAEYKMWGNGIALPTALYVMQGIKEASNESY